MITQQRLKQLLHYDPDTGEWTWLVDMSNLVRAGRRAGKVAGPLRNQYRQITIAGEHYYLMRLAFLYMTGKWPTEQVDHSNRDGLDDRWTNLREATPHDNNANRRTPSNNTSGYKGVSWDRVSQKWDARVDTFRIGLFDDIEEAAAARDAIALEWHGPFAVTNGG